jgi:hypothetical protein
LLKPRLRNGPAQSIFGIPVDFLSGVQGGFLLSKNSLSVLLSAYANSGNAQCPMTVREEHETSPSAPMTPHLSSYLQPAALAESRALIAKSGATDSISTCSSHLDDACFINRQGSNSS